MSYHRSIKSWEEPVRGGNRDVRKKLEQKHDRHRGGREADPYTNVSIGSMDHVDHKSCLRPVSLPDSP
jgi:hypothetical protein